MTRDFFKDGFIEKDFYPSVIRRSDDKAGLIKQVVDRANAILKAELGKIKWHGPNDGPITVEGMIALRDVVTE